MSRKRKRDEPIDLCESDSETKPAASAAPPAPVLQLPENLRAPQPDALLQFLAGDHAKSAITIGVPRKKQFARQVAPLLASKTDGMSTETFSSKYLRDLANKNCELSSVTLSALCSVLNARELALRPSPDALILSPYETCRPYKARLLEKYRGVQRLLGCFATAAHGAHWVLYEATYQHAARTFKLRLYDSMGGETKPRLQDATELFSEELGVHYDLSGSVTVVSSPQQDDIIKCGVHCIVNGIYRMFTPDKAFGKKKPYSTEDIATYRVALAHMLLQCFG